MKKILIATTALVAAGFIATGAQAADKIKLELGGFSKWFVVGVWQDRNYRKSDAATGNQPSFNNVDVKGQSDITFSGSVKLDNGLDVGVFTAMRAGTNTGVNAGDSQNLIDRAYLYVGSGYGKVIMGVLQNATHLLHVQAPESIGQWGEDGLLTNGNIIQVPFNFFGVNANGINSTSILPGQDGGKVEGISYISPTFYGLTIGGSYIPNDRKNVRGPVNIEGTMNDFFSAGANYTNNFGDIGVKASFGWARSNFGRQWTGGGSDTNQTVNFFNTGLNLSYAGFTLGGSMRWNAHDMTDGGLNSIYAPPGISLNGHAWDIGLMYATGPWAASVSYYNSRVDGFSRSNAGKKEEVNFVQASAKYDLGPGVALQGLVGYGEYKGFANIRETQSVDVGTLNRGWTAMTGVAVQF